MVQNVQFSYLYRDSGNYKNFGVLIFENTSDITIDDLKNLIKSKLICDTWFYTYQWQLPDLRFPECDYEVNPSWHEFENVEYTDKAINTSKKLAELLYRLHQMDSKRI